MFPDDMTMEYIDSPLGDYINEIMAQYMVPRDIWMNLTKMPIRIFYGDYISDDYFSLGDEPKSMTLEEGNFLYVQGPLLFGAADFDISDYYTYETPEGTYVPAGVYMVGEGDDKDIPPGTFAVYPGTISGGDVKIYYSQETFEDDGSWHLGYDKHYEVRVRKNQASETIILEEGYVLLVEKDVVMKKGSGGTKLVFD